MIDAVCMCESWCQGRMSLNCRMTRLHSSTCGWFRFFLCTEAVGSKQQQGLASVSSQISTEREQLPAPTSQVCMENLNSSEVLLGKPIKEDIAISGVKNCFQKQLSIIKGVKGQH